jgi:hypothetical protein
VRRSVQTSTAKISKKNNSTKPQSHKRKMDNSGFMKNFFKFSMAKMKISKSQPEGKMYF